MASLFLCGVGLPLVVDTQSGRRRASASERAAQALGLRRRTGAKPAGLHFCRHGACASRRCRCGLKTRGRPLFLRVVFRGSHTQGFAWVPADGDASLPGGTVVPLKSIDLKYEFRPLSYVFV